MNLSSWSDRIIRLGFYLLLTLVPLTFTPWNHELFEYNKMMITYAATVMIVSAWVVKMINAKKIQVAKTPLDIPLLLFVGSQFISTVFSMDPHVSWIGYYSRFNGGMWSVICYVLLYYAFVSNIRLNPVDTPPAATKKAANTNEPIMVQPDTGYITRLLNVGLITACVVGFYGVLERLGIDKHLWVQDVQNRVFSTLGQPNWLAAYLVTLIPIAIAFALNHLPNSKSSSFGRILQHASAAGMAILFFVVLLFTRSRSGLFALAVADMTFWLLLLVRTKHKKVLGISFAFLHILFVLIVFINGSNIAQIDKYFSFSGLKARLTNPQTAPTQPPDYKAPLLEYGGTESGTIRKYVWQGAIVAWRSSTKAFLIGTGTETFAFAFYQFRPKEHNLTSEWDFLYNKAHNEYLNYLATTGIIGLGTYLLYIGFATVLFLKSYRALLSSQTKEHQKTSYTIAALFSGWLSILVTNFFGFSVVIMQLFLFLFPAFLWSFLPHEEKTHYVRSKQLRLSSGQRAIAYGTSGVVGFGLLLLLWTHWQADVLFEKGYRLARAGQLAQAHVPIEHAIRLNPWEPLYHDELASNLSTLASSAYEQQQATLGAQLAARSLEESDKTIATSPNNVNFWKTRTKVYYALSSVDPALNQAAIQALKRAAELSPNDPKIYYNLAILFGRAGDNAQAIQMLQTAKNLKPNYRDAYFGLHVFYTEMKKQNEAKQILEEYLRIVDPNDEDFRKRIGAE